MQPKFVDMKKQIDFAAFARSSKTREGPFISRRVQLEEGGEEEGITCKGRYRLSSSFNKDADR